MAKIVLVQLVCESGDRPPDEVVRVALEAEGILTPEDCMSVIEVKEMPVGPPSFDQLQEMRQSLKLADDDDLAVMAVRCNKATVPFSELLGAMLLGRLLLGDPRRPACYVCGDPDCPSCVPTPRVPTWPDEN